MAGRDMAHLLGHQIVRQKHVFLLMTTRAHESGETYRQVNMSAPVQVGKQRKIEGKSSARKLTIALPAAIATPENGTTAASAK